MCGRFAQYRIPWDYIEPIGLDVPLLGGLDPAPVARYNTPSTPVLTLHQDRDGLRFTPVPWGYMPYWAKGKRPPAIKARVETAATSKFFKDVWQTGRCIVPADGWCAAHWLDPELTSREAEEIVREHGEPVEAFEWYPVGREAGNGGMRGGSSFCRCSSEARRSALNGTAGRGSRPSGGFRLRPCGGSSRPSVRTFPQIPAKPESTAQSFSSELAWTGIA